MAQLWCIKSPRGRASPSKVWKPLSVDSAVNGYLCRNRKGYDSVRRWLDPAFHHPCPRYSGNLTPTAPTAIRLWENLYFFIMLGFLFHNNPKGQMYLINHSIVLNSQVRMILIYYKEIKSGYISSLLESWFQNYKTYSTISR